MRLVVLGLALVLGATPCRLLGLETGPLAYVVAVTPWVGGAAAVFLLVSLLLRARASAVVAVVLVAVHVWWLVPLYRADTAPTSTRTWTVASSNLMLGEGDVRDVVAVVRDSGADVLAVQELTPEALRRFESAGLDELLPYRYVAAMPGIQGTGLWSRTPMSDAREVPGFVSRTIVAAVEGRTVVAAHPAAPGVRDGSVWAGDHARLASLLESLTGEVVLVGDLNATRDQTPVRRLETDGFVDAPDQAGTGLAMTYPNNRGYPPLVAIDHVMVRSGALTAIAFRAHDIGASDHRTVVASYAVT